MSNADLIASARYRPELFGRNASGMITDLADALEAAEATIARIVAVGHNDDCLFCGLKDRAALGQERTIP